MKSKHEQCTYNLTEWIYTVLYCHWCMSVVYGTKKLLYWQKSVDYAGISGDVVTRLLFTSELTDLLTPLLIDADISLK